MRSHTKQTRVLSTVMPQFAPLFASVDRRGSSEWQVVQWRNIALAAVNREHMQPVSALHGVSGPRENRFGSRTEALRFSDQWARTQYGAKPVAGLKGWVWSWQDGADRVYQTVMPISSEPSASDHTGRKQPPASTSNLVRLTDPAYRMLRRRAAEEGMTLQATLEAAIDMYDRHRFFERTNEAFAALRSDPEAWAAELEERKLWEATLADGIEPDDYSIAGTAAEPERKSA